MYTSARSNHAQWPVDIARSQAFVGSAAQVSSTLYAQGTVQTLGYCHTHTLTRMHTLERAQVWGSVGVHNAGT